MDIHKKPVITLLIIGCLMSSDVMAQKRNSFVIGFGIAPGLISFDPGSSTETDPSLAAGFRIGGNISDRVQLYFSTLISPVGRKYLHSTLYGLDGFTVRYFMNDQPPSIFITAGGDIGFWDVSGEDVVIIPKLNSGLGPHVGSGYEISEHWNAEGTLSWISGQGNNLKVFSFWLTANYEF